MIFSSRWTRRGRLWTRGSELRELIGYRIAKYAAVPAVVDVKHVVINLRCRAHSAVTTCPRKYLYKFPRS